tara:strand:- start:306 stop:488 length:183 start_codon:yes stop_codon:yes gene_type:complete
MTIQNHQQAYYQALVLALTTKDKTLQKECESMAESFATHITEDQAKECRDKIESILGGTK